MGGFSGIAVITGADEFRRKTIDKSSVGRPFAGMLANSAAIVGQAISSAVRDSDKPFCSGRTTPGKFDKVTKVTRLLSNPIKRNTMFAWCLTELPA